MMTTRPKALYVELADEDRVKLDRLAANSGAAEGRPVSLAEIVRQLVRDATLRRAPIRIRS